MRIGSRSIPQLWGVRLPEDIRSIWAWPAAGKVPDIRDLIAAPDVAAVIAAATPWLERAAQGHEAEAERTIAQTRALAADLGEKGVHMDVDRMLRGTPLERLQMAWDDARFWVQDKVDELRGGSDDMEDEALLSLPVDLGATRPTREIAAEYDEIDAEVARFADGLADQIAALRGPAQRLELPPDIDLEWDDAELEEADWFYEASDICAYWPAGDQPSLAISIVQADGGLPISVSIHLRGATADAELRAAIEAAGGRFT